MRTDLKGTISKLRKKKQILLSLARKKRNTDIRVQRAISEEIRLKREIRKLKQETSPLGKVYKRMRSPTTRRKLKSMYRSFQKFANKYGG